MVHHRLSEEKLNFDKKEERLKLSVKFFLNEAGSEPVRDWLKSLPKEDSRRILVDIKTVQLGWPLGMPLMDSIGSGIWEVRTKLLNSISRILFIAEEGQLILLHGLIKKTPKTPKQDIDIAKDRIKILIKLKKYESNCKKEV